MEDCDLLDIEHEKGDLTPENNPFVEFLDDGYWRNENMAKQFENVIDCLKALQGDKYDFMFLFDHSSGHDKKVPMGLNVKSMGVKYGGKKENV